MADRLERYREKRHFADTPEPTGGTAAEEGTARFVVQEHSARSMHRDRRLDGEGGRLRLASRRANNITARYPELRELGRALGTHEAVIDGEVVAFDDQGRPSFQRLQRRMHLTSEAQVRRLSVSDPVVYVIFDLL